MSACRTIVERRLPELTPHPRSLNHGEDEPRKTSEIVPRVNFNALAGLSDNDLNKRFKLDD